MVVVAALTISIIFYILFVKGKEERCKPLIDFLFIFKKGFQIIWKKKWLFLLPMGIHLLSLSQLLIKHITYWRLEQEGFSRAIIESFLKKHAVAAAQVPSALIHLIPDKLDLHFQDAIPALCIVLPLAFLILRIYSTRSKKHKEKQILKFLFPFVILLTLACIGISYYQIQSSYFGWLSSLSQKATGGFFSSYFMPVFIIYLLTILALTTFIDIILYAGIKDELFDEKMGWIEIISYTVSRFLPLFLFCLFISLIFFIPYLPIILFKVARHFPYYYTLLVYIQIFVFLLLMFVPFIIVFEKAGVISAIRRNLEIWKSNWKTIIIFILLAVIINFPFRLIIIMMEDARLNILLTEGVSLVEIFIQMIIMVSLIFLWFGLVIRDVFSQKEVH